MSLAARQTIETEILRCKARTGLPLETILRYAGISQRTWREWSARRGVETKHNCNIPKHYFLTPEEITAVVSFCAENQLKGCRMQRREMADKNKCGFCVVQQRL